MEIKKRLLKIELPPTKSAFLWGPRQVGKSHWIRHHMQHAVLIDLLKTDVFMNFASHPALLRERYADTSQRIVIDEIQKAPDLLDEVHWLIENKRISFLLTGSSARKLRQKHANLLGGRAWRYTMTPLCYPEVSGFDIERVMVSGLLPEHFLSPDPIKELRAYVADYLKEEIAAEAVVQNIPAFADFLRICAITNGEILNYTNVARETAVSAKVVRNYFQIIEDTLLGFRLQPWRKSKDRRLVETEKFYLFDVGVANYLARRRPAVLTTEFGKSFEHYILMELKAYQAYRDPEMLLHYWRTSSDIEVDFILGDMEIAIEVKATRRVNRGSVKGLLSLANEFNVKKLVLISLEEEPKKLDAVECLPWKIFLEKLWSGEII